MPHRRRRTTVRQWTAVRLRRATPTFWLIVGLVLFCLVLFSLTIVWGNTLGKKAQRSALERAAAQATQTPKAVEWVKNVPNDIRAPLLQLRDRSIAEILQNAEAQADLGHKAISLSLYTGGTVHYTSALSISLGFQTRPDDKAQEIGLPRLCATASVRGLYVSGCLVCRHPTIYNWQARRVMAAYEAALVSEMSDSGCDEILLIGLNVTSASMDEILSFLRTVRENAPNATVGVALTCTSLLAEDGLSGTRLYTVLTYADFCALDLSDAESVTLTDEKGETKTLTFGETLEKLRTPIALYKLRLLLPESAVERAEQLQGLGYTGVQLIPDHY